MSAKITASRRAAFLKALGETGNVTLSAERAKVSRRWVQVQRKADCGFDAEFLNAKRQSFDKLRMSGERKPSKGWGFADGEELVVKGSKTPFGNAQDRLRDAAGAAPLRHGSGQAQDERKHCRVQIARARCGRSLRGWRSASSRRSPEPATSWRRRAGLGSARAHSTPTASAGRTSSGDGWRR